jgi:sulfur carrier protein ThiS
MLTSSELDLAGPRSVEDYVLQLKANAKKVAAKMNGNLLEARRKQKMYYDQNVKDSV